MELFFHRCLDFSTLFCGLETSGLSSRRPAGTKVAPGWQAVRLKNRPAPLTSSPTTRGVSASRGATTPREASTSCPSTARWEGPPPTPIRCSCELGTDASLNKGNQELGMLLRRKAVIRSQSALVDTNLVGYYKTNIRCKRSPLLFQRLC